MSLKNDIYVFVFCACSAGAICALAFEAESKCWRALEMETKELSVHQRGLNASADSIVMKRL